jgi:hypothetical protein
MVAALAVPARSSSSDDARAMRIVERDWCDFARYDRARQVRGLSRAARRNLFEAVSVVRAHRNGCALGETFAGGRSDPLSPQEAPWLRNGCPRGQLVLRPGSGRRAAEVAAAGQPRPLRPVVVRVGLSDRSSQVSRLCGRIALRRTVIVSLTLTGYLPSASLSERVVAVARFRHYGWRVWLLLH